MIWHAKPLHHQMQDEIGNLFTTSKGSMFQSKSMDSLIFEVNSQSSLLWKVFVQLLFSFCSVLVQFASILIDMLRSKCPHLKTNWPLLRLHVEMNAFSSSFLLIFEWYILGILYTRIFFTRCNRMALTTRTHIHLKRKTTQSIDICIHKSHSIYQRNDVTQKKERKHKTSYDTWTKTLYV